MTYIPPSEGAAVWIGSFGKTALAGRYGVEFDLASLPELLERHGLRAD
ncbi:MAG: hypothetical protein ACJ8DC_14745 [Gemmatimonadales bacterium]